MMASADSTLSSKIGKKFYETTPGEHISAMFLGRKDLS